MCLLGVLLTLLLILGVKSPKTPILGAWIGVFEAKRAKYCKFQVIETPASISTTFCTTMEIIKWSSRVVPIGAQQIQDGGRPPFWKKPLNRHISATVWPILMRFGTMILYPYSVSTVKISNSWKSKMAAAAILKNHKNRDISATVWPIFTKFRTLMKIGPLTAPTVKKFEFHKSKMAYGRHFANR